MTSVPDPEERTRAAVAAPACRRAQREPAAAVVSPARRVWRVARFVPLLMALVATGGVGGALFPAARASQTDGLP